jgi:hypothetical protein
MLYPLSYEGDAIPDNPWTPHPWLRSRDTAILRIARSDTADSPMTARPNGQQ